MIHNFCNSKESKAADRVQQILAYDNEGGGMWRENSVEGRRGSGEHLRGGGAWVCVGGKNIIPNIPIKMEYL